jgi:hypothetical protein
MFFNPVLKSPLPTKDKRFLIALAVSLLFHAALIFIKFATPPEPLLSDAQSVPSELQVRLAGPQAPSPPPVMLQPAPRPAPPTPSTARRPSVRLQMPPTRSVEAEKTWSQAEKDEMSRFLSDLNTEARPPTGRALEQKALAMARAIGAQGDRDDEAIKIAQRLRAAKIEPFNIEQYYEALFRKLNSSAAMERNKSKQAGSHVAVVRVVLNPDGSVKSFTIQQAADQQAEIAYIQSVVERAAPFPAFPADIRKATDEMILQICIQPRGYGPGGGAFFSRLSRGQSCRGEG